MAVGISGRSGKWLDAVGLICGPPYLARRDVKQAEVGMGDERVRAPRLVLEGAERDEALRVIRGALAQRPKV